MHDEADMVSAVFDRDACRGLSGGGGGRRRSSGGRDRRFCRWMSCARDAGCLLDGYFLQGMLDVGPDLIFFYYDWLPGLI
jgi:hypothetical protein